MFLDVCVSIPQALGYVRSYPITLIVSCVSILQDLAMCVCTPKSLIYTYMFVSQSHWHQCLYPPILVCVFVSTKPCACILKSFMYVFLSNSNGYVIYILKPMYVRLYPPNLEYVYLYPLSLGNVFWFLPSVGFVCICIPQALCISDCTP